MQISSCFRILVTRRIETFTVILLFSLLIQLRFTTTVLFPEYGAILVGAAVIVFLMALSLLVRFVMNKHLWYG